MVAVRNPIVPEAEFWLYRLWPVNLLMYVSCCQQVEMLNIMLHAFCIAQDFRLPPWCSQGHCSSQMLQCSLLVC